MTCSCIAINHPLHLPAQCDEPPIIAGGICVTCRFAEGFSKPTGDPAEMLRCFECGSWFNNRRHWQIVEIDGKLVGVCPTHMPLAWSHES